VAHIPLPASEFMRRNIYIYICMNSCVATSIYICIYIYIPLDQTVEFGDFQSAMEKFDQSDVSVMLGGENEFAERVQSKDQKLFLDWEYVSRGALHQEISVQAVNGELTPRIEDENDAALQVD
jgi:hypothetical protein